MIKGSEKRHADQPINPLFMDRWSPRAMSGEPLAEQELLTLFEAARWAPSASNSQPWRILYARRDTPQWATFFGLLVEMNQGWAQHAAALLVWLSDTQTDPAKPSATSSFDTGAAWQSLALQGWMSGLVVHGMGGFHRDRAREVLQIPERYRIEAMAAIGKPGAMEKLPEKLQARETPSARRPLAQSICEGVFAFE